VFLLAESFYFCKKKKFCCLFLVQNFKLSSVAYKRDAYKKNVYLKKTWKTRKTRTWKRKIQIGEENIHKFYFYQKIWGKSELSELPNALVSEDWTWT